MKNKQDKFEKALAKSKKFLRSSTAEYLTYVAAVGDNPKSIEVRYEDENIWLTKDVSNYLWS